MQLNFQIPDKVVEGLDTFVDGVRFRNRAQLITVILADWLASMKNPVDPYAEAWIGRGEAIAAVRDKRATEKADLLGPDGASWRAQGVDLLDGEWEERQRSAAASREAEASDERRALVAEIAAMVKAEVLAELDGAQPEPKKKGKTGAKKNKTRA